MPYKPEELQELEWYQNLLSEDEQQYSVRREYLLGQTDISGSAYDGSLMARDSSNTILLFENPWTDALPEDPETKVIYITKVKKLKIEESYGVLNDVLDREFKEIT